MDELFTAWTLPAILTAIASGIAGGFVIHRLRPAADHRIVGYLAAVLLALWYVPQAGRLVAVPDTADPVRTLSVWLMAEVWFVLPSWLVLRWLNRRHVA